MECAIALVINLYREAHWVSTGRQSICRVEKASFGESSYSADIRGRSWRSAQDVVEVESAKSAMVEVRSPELYSRIPARLAIRKAADGVTVARVLDTPVDRCVIVHLVDQQSYPVTP